MSLLNQIIEPSLLVDKEIAMRNLRRMAAVADQHGLIYRPHFKTHQSAEIADWHRELGIKRITVSSFRMAGYFARHGWEDITVAFPVNVREISRINELAQKINLQIVAESVETLQYLAEELKAPVTVMLKTDTGYRRTGISASDFPTIDAMIAAVAESKMLSFGGFLAHAGHSYDTSGKEAVLAIHAQALEALRGLDERYRGSYPNMIISLGDTPTMSHAKSFGPVNEIRPGNLIFYDLAQVEIGSCDFGQIAVCMACPVVALHPERNEIVLYGGGVHFSKDSCTLDGRTVYGLPVWLREEGTWSEPVAGSYVKKLSQEHGIVKASPELMEAVQPGDLLGVLPVHSCLTADAAGRFLRRDGGWIDMMSKKN